MIKTIETKISDDEYSRLIRAVILATITTTIWGLLQGFFRQTESTGWSTIPIWGFAGFAIGPGLGIAMRFPPDVLRPWPQVALAILRGLTYGIVLGLATQVQSLFFHWNAGFLADVRDLQVEDFFTFAISIAFLTTARQLNQFSGQIRASKTSQFLANALFSVGFIVGLIFWGFYGNFWDHILSLNSIRHVLMNAFFLILFSSPFGIFAGSIGIVVTVSKLITESDGRDDLVAPS